MKKLYTFKKTIKKAKRKSTAMQFPFFIKTNKGINISLTRKLTELFNNKILIYIKIGTPPICYIFNHNKQPQDN